MGEWMRICCAVEFSDQSRAAMEAAADLTRQHGAKLTLAHVREPPPDAAENFFAPGREEVEENARERRDLLASWRADAERLAGVSVDSRLLIGSPATEIVRCAREQRFDLIVVATHGRRGVAHLMLGSVAERIVREAPCSVLVVRRVAAQAL